MCQKVGYPLRVLHVRLPAGDILDVGWVGQDEREASTQDMPDGLPIDARCFHGHLRHLVFLQPVREGEQALGQGPK